MPRKRLDPTIRFDDVVPVWNAALRDGGGLVRTNSDNESISLIYRLNQYRKIVREDEPAGWTEMDRYVVRKGNLCVEIERRMPINLLTRMTKLDGTPISAPRVMSSPLDETAAQYVQEGNLINNDEDDEDDSNLTFEEKRLRDEVKRNMAKRMGKE